jgi:hypothetical protein
VLHQRDRDHQQQTQQHGRDQRKANPKKQEAVLADQQKKWPAQELRRWIYGGGRVLPGLVERRNAEVLMLLL